MRVARQFRTPFHLALWQRGSPLTKLASELAVLTYPEASFMLSSTSTVIVGDHSPQ